MSQLSNWSHQLLSSSWLSKVATNTLINYVLLHKLCVLEHTKSFKNDTTFELMSRYGNWSDLIYTHFHSRVKILKKWAIIEFMFRSRWSSQRCSNYRALRKSAASGFFPFIRRWSGEWKYQIHIKQKRKWKCSNFFQLQSLLPSLKTTTTDPSTQLIQSIQLSPVEFHAGIVTQQIWLIVWILVWKNLAQKTPKVAW